jgi:hypothetical protein
MTVGDDRFVGDAVIAPLVSRGGVAVEMDVRAGASTREDCVDTLGFADIEVGLDAVNEI